jgi:hypothetical protein
MHLSKITATLLPGKPENLGFYYPIFLLQPES